MQGSLEYRFLFGFHFPILLDFLFSFIRVYTYKENYFS